MAGYPTPASRPKFAAQGRAIMNRCPEYLRAGEIARRTGMSVRTVRRWISDEIIPSTKLGGARLVAKADLRAAFSPAKAHSGEEDSDDDA
jgi:excisionase family DNA binding protein